MRISGFRLLVATLVVFFTATLGASGDAIASGERKVAFVLGNSAYVHGVKLDNPVNDATAVAEKFRTLGFEVVEGYDADLDKTRGLLREFSKKAEGAGIAAFFYAGHGIQVDGANYILPIDVQLEDRASLAYEAVQVDFVMEQMSIDTKIKIVILDACRNNPLARNFSKKSRSANVGSGLAAIDIKDPGEGTFVVFATQPGNFAADGVGKHSPFSQALLRYFDEPDIEFTTMISKVMSDVSTATEREQLPWMNFTQPGGPVFLKQTAEVAAVVEEKQVEVAALQTNETVRSATELSAQADPATSKAIEEAKQNEQEPSAVSNLAVEKQFFDYSRDQNTVEAYQAYLEQYPNGVFAGLAKSAIVGLEKRLAAVQSGTTLQTTERSLVQQQTASLSQGNIGGAVEAGDGTVLSEEQLDLDREDRQAIQQRLKLMGFSSGRPDGSFGPKTRAQISGWQQSRGFQPTGYLNSVQYGQLITESAEEYASWQSEVEQRLAAQASAPRQKSSGGSNGRRIVRNGGNEIGQAIVGGIVGGIISRKLGF